MSSSSGRSSPEPQRVLEPLDRVAMRRLSVQGASDAPTVSELEIEEKLIEDEKDEIVGELTPPVSVAQRRRSLASGAPGAPRIFPGEPKMNQFANAALSSLKEGNDFLVKKLRGEDSSAPTVEDPMLGFMNYDNHLDIANELSLEGGDKARRNNATLILLKLTITIAIALFTAAMMFCVSRIAGFCFSKRVSSTLALIEGGYVAGAYFQFIGISMLLTAIASILVAFVAPSARGGGVPYALAYLNGTNVSNFFTFRIGAIKAAALGFTIAGGLTLGMEGPFVFLGGGVAILLSKTLDRLPAFSAQGKYTRILRNIKEERVFMSGGLAAGLAVAFSAPIAGILFALEGATAFLTVPVTLRIFGCSMFAMFFYDLSRADFSYNIKSHNLIEIVKDSDQEYAWMVPEIASFTILALIGGLLGAGAVKLNVWITKWRHHHMDGKVYKNIGEVLLITFVTGSCWFVLPFIFGCRPQPDFCARSAAAGEMRCVQAFCGAGEYSEIGSIVFSTTDIVVRNLFDRSVGEEFEFSPWPLLVYGICYTLLVSWVYGAYVPGGLFVPSIVIGGVYGRIVGYIGNRYVASYISPGIYSLLGAAGMLGGFTRLALPVVVMLIEMTGDATYLLPIMYIATTAKLLADYLEPPLYPQHMALEGIPTLGDQLKPQIARLTARELMNSSPVSLIEIDSVGHILEVLKRSKATLIPVTDNKGHFVGMIMRTSVLFALNHTTFYDSLEEIHGAQQEEKRQESEKPALLKAEREFSDWADTTDYAATLHGFDKKLHDSLIDLRTFMDRGALTCRENSSAKRVAALFRRVGLSHVCVCNEQNRLVGVITRRHLIQINEKKPEKLSVSKIAEEERDKTGKFSLVSPRAAPLGSPAQAPIRISILPPSPIVKALDSRSAEDFPRAPSDDEEEKENPPPVENSPGYEQPEYSEAAQEAPEEEEEEEEEAELIGQPTEEENSSSQNEEAPEEPEEPEEEEEEEEKPSEPSYSPVSLASPPSSPPPVSVSSPSAVSSPPFSPVLPPAALSAAAASRVSGGLFSQPSAEELAARENIQARARAKKEALNKKLQQLRTEQNKEEK